MSKKLIIVGSGNAALCAGISALEKGATVKILEKRLSHITKPITLSIIGCVVNGPGEAAQTEIGITGGGKGNHMMYLNGVESEKIKSEEIISKVVSMVEKKAKEIEEKN